MHTLTSVYSHVLKAFILKLINPSCWLVAVIGTSAPKIQHAGLAHRWPGDGVTRASLVKIEYIIASL
jgi:hypothetical protein